ncbi:MAG: DUF3089 domain-containing protein [Anaerolineae bacterium]|nr:MAG: DUF3089 domain-containing protein [Anaerolineae bacterium]
MKSKLKGFIVFSVIALVALACARGSREVAGLRPAENFSAAPTPTPPDYASGDLWAARPEGADDADFSPPGSEPSENQTDAEADVFFIHPTTYYSNDHWNMPLDEASRGEQSQNTLLNQASVFNACCRVFAPRYRQATLATFFSVEDYPGPMALAYEDVRAAFIYYLEHDNGGRPFILAGHSQGSYHLLRLLQEEVSGHPVRKLLVAAYIIGAPVPLDHFERTLPDLPPCTSASQTGCVVSWLTYDLDATPSFYQRLNISYYQGVYERNDDNNFLCVNPLTWQLDQVWAGAALNLGGLPLLTRPTAFEGFDPAAADAQCDERGLLRIHPPESDGYSSGIFENGNYHTADYNLFYLNLRQNAVERVEAFLVGR